MKAMDHWKPRLRRAVDAWRERRLPPPQPIPHRHAMPMLDEAARSRLELRSSPGTPFLDVEVPELPQVPGMITEAEGQFLYWLTSRGYTGKGAVVEVGTWMGRSTIHLAAGLRDAGFHQHLHCFDKYAWCRAYEAPWLEVGFSLPIGADFMPCFERNVRPVYPGLRVDKATIDQLDWDRGPIEILFLDAPKTYRDVSRILAHFSSHLVPGLSIVVLQDYLLATTYCIAMLVAGIPAMEQLYVVPGSSTVAFAVTGPMAVSRPLETWRYDERDLGEILEIWGRILAPLEPEARCRIEPGLALLLYERGQLRDAIERLRAIHFTESGLHYWNFLGRTGWSDRYRELFEVPLEVSVC